jgi:hypothetical protein
LACCCSSAACGLLGCCPSCRNSSAARIMYAIMLFLTTIVGWVMTTEWVKEKMKNVPFCSNNENNCENVVGFLAVYRVMFALTMFFIVFALIMFNVKTSKDGRAPIQNGYRCFHSNLIYFQISINHFLFIKILGNQIFAINRWNGWRFFHSWSQYFWRRFAFLFIN